MLITISAVAGMLASLTVAGRLTDQLNAISTRPTGSFFEVDLYNDMLTVADDGLKGNNLYRVDTAHSYTWFGYSHADGMTLNSGDAHDFYLWPESLSLSGHLASGTIKLVKADTSTIVVPVTNALFRDSFTSTGRYQLNDYKLTGNGYGVLSVLPTVFPPRDGFIISNLEWRNLVEFPAVHIFARRNHSSNEGVLRFGGERPNYDYLNVTNTEGECFAMTPMNSLPDQNSTSFKYTIQVDLITSDGGFTVYNPPLFHQGYQIDTMYPFIHVVENNNALNTILGNFSAPGRINSTDGMAEVDCDAVWNKPATEIVIDTERFPINPVDMVVKNPFNDGRCFSAYQQQLTQGLYKLGWPFLFNTGVTFDFENMSYNITSRPYYPE